MEAELFRHEKLELEAEIHIVVDFLQFTVFFQHVSELLRGEPRLYEFLDFDEAQFFLSFLKLVLDVGKSLKIAELLLNFSPVGFYLGVEESFLNFRLFFIVKARFNSYQLDPSLKFLRRCRENGHIIAKSPQPFCIVDIPLIVGLIEENRKNLQVIVAH